MFFFLVASSSVLQIVYPPIQRDADIRRLESEPSFYIQIVPSVKYASIHTGWRTKCHTIDCAHKPFLLLQKHLISGLQRRPKNVAQLRAHIVKLCRALSEDLCRKVVTNARVRLQEVVRQNGGHIEHVLP